MQFVNAVKFNVSCYVATKVTAGFYSFDMRMRRKIKENTILNPSTHNDRHVNDHSASIQV